MVQVQSVISILSVLQKRYARWLARWRARSATNFKLRLAMLLGFGVMVTVVGAALYRWSNPDEDWSSSLFTVYAVLYSIPGADITNNESMLATFVLNLIFIFGLLVFATILAMITDEINNVMLAARSGKAPVALTGHILLLNWNQQVPFILDQLEQIQLKGGAHPFANRPLVILADKDKEELDSLVVGLLKHGQLEVHTRSGKPYRMEHLARCAAGDAFAVLLMHPEAGGGDDDDDESGGGGGGDEEGGGDDASISVVGAAAAVQDSGGAAALKMQTIMALTSLQAGKKVAMVVQAPDDSNIGLQELDQVLLWAGHPANLMNLPVRKMVNSLAVQTTLQPWSATIYHNILQQGLQPSLTFTKVPDTLFVLKSSREAVGSPTAALMATGGRHIGRQGGESRYYMEDVDCTVSFEEARVAVSRGMLTLGYISQGDGQLHLNPCETSRLSPGDVLVALTTRDKVAAEGIQLPLRARIQAKALQVSAIALNNPVGRKLMSLSKPKAASAAALPAAGVAAGAGAAAVAAASAATTTSVTPTADGASSSSSGGSASAPAKAHERAGSWGSLDAIQEGAGGSSQASPAAVAAGATAAGVGVGAGLAASELQPVNVKHAADPEIAAIDSVPPPAASSGMPRDLTAAAPLTPEPAAPSTPKATSAASTAGSAAAGAAAVAAAAGGAAALAAGGGAGSRTSASTPAAAADLAAADDSTRVAGGAAAAGGLLQDSSKPTKPKKKSGGLFACCFAPSVADDDDEAFRASGSSKTPPRFGSGGKATSFKVGTFDVGKTVTGAVSTVGKGVTTVGKGVTSAVTTVADGAVGVTKTVVTGAVSTVADGAQFVGKTVTTVADGAVGLTKTVATGAVSTVVGGAGLITSGAGLITKTVTNAVPLGRSESSAGAQGGGLLGAPAGWLFGGAKKQNEAKAAAFGRLANVDVATARAPPAEPLSIVVSGFTADEAASELLPHFLDFAPANSTVTFVIKESSPPEGFELQGTVEEEEEREGAEPLHHCVHYTFLPSSNPTSGAALSEAGVLQADAVLLAADEALRASPAEADAAVLSALVSIQHLLACKGATVALSHSRSIVGKSSNSSSAPHGSSASLFGSGPSSMFSSVTKGVATVGKGALNVGKGAANLTFKAAATAVTAAKNLTILPMREDSLAANQQSRNRRRQKVPHVVACVSTMSSKAVAAAFFGPPSAGQLAAAAAAVGGGVATGVVGSRLFTYELLVPGEIEGSVLVQVANEPLYVKVVHEMLVTSEGCELYLLGPKAFGFTPGEELAFAEVQEVGRLLRRTCIGVVSDGVIELVPDNTWRWKVQENDRIAAIADSW